MGHSSVWCEASLFPATYTGVGLVSAVHSIWHGDHLKSNERKSEHRREVEWNHSHGVDVLSERAYVYACACVWTGHVHECGSVVWARLAPAGGVEASTANK